MAKDIPFLYVFTSFDLSPNRETKIIFQDPFYISIIYYYNLKLRK